MILVRNGQNIDEIQEKSVFVCLKNIKNCP